MITNSIDLFLTYYRYPSALWRRIRTNNPLERIMREVRRRERVVGAFPDGNGSRSSEAYRRHKVGTPNNLDLQGLKEAVKEEIAAA